ncbi:cytochrome P450 [Aspergillus alliaceus]|uniref:Cytochrome P450 n=1 Tax=Petromyces alliaceus TaxID=209559 RepID=A0A5N7CSM4_PETAA|nr:cytochrome P450 [Aspergillus alliaceus]
MWMIGISKDPHSGSQPNRANFRRGAELLRAPNQHLCSSVKGAGRCTSANNTKSRVYQALIHGAPNTLIIHDKENHSWCRRILGLAFSDARILSYRSILTRHINVLSAPDTECHCPINYPVGDYFTFDAIAEIIFGMRYNALREPTYRFVAHALEASNVRISALAQAPMLTTGRLDKNLFPSSIRGRNQFLGFISSLLRCCSKASFSDNGNMFTFLETTKDPYATLVVAGRDASSMTLAGNLFYLSGNPRAYQHVCEEIRGKFATRDQVTMAYLSSCVYFSLWREIGPGGMTIGSLELLAGIDAGTGICSLHHNEYHPEPFEYRPERGPRSCVGKGFAYHELTLTLAHALLQFDFQHVDGSKKKEFSLRDHVTGAKTGLSLRFTLRQQQ